MDSRIVFLAFTCSAFLGVGAHGPLTCRQATCADNERCVLVKEPEESAILIPVTKCISEEEYGIMCGELNCKLDCLIHEETAKCTEEIMREIMGFIPHFMGGEVPASDGGPDQGDEMVEKWRPGRNGKGRKKNRKGMRGNSGSNMQNEEQNGENAEGGENGSAGMMGIFGKMKKGRKHMGKNGKGSGNKGGNSGRSGSGSQVESGEMGNWGDSWKNDESDVSKFMNKFHRPRFGGKGKKKNKGRKFPDIHGQGHGDGGWDWKDIGGDGSDGRIPHDWHGDGGHDWHGDGGHDWHGDGEHDCNHTSGEVSESPSPPPETTSGSDTPIQDPAPETTNAHEPPTTQEPVTSPETTNEPVTTTQAPGCGAVCEMFCEHGNVMDASGCPTCECNPDPCGELVCDLACPSGREKDAQTGCDVCLCKGCEKTDCKNKECPDGFKVDANGCRTCACLKE